MSDPTLDTDLAAYLAQPTAGDRLAASYQLRISLVGLLQRLAQERGVPVDALVEHMLFKAMRAEHARRLVDEKPDPIPASFLDERVARAKEDVAKDVAAVRGMQEERGDRASRIAGQMEAMLGDLTGDADAELDTLKRRALEDEAKIDLALQKKR